MATYITLMKMTEQGIKDVKRLSARYKEGVKQLQAMGGKLVGFYMVMGEYDYVGIAEAPSDEIVMAFNLGLGARGNVRTTTLRAFTVEEYSKIAEKLPQAGK